MRLKVKYGESVDNAIRYLQAFLEQYKDDYPILESNLNIYITLKAADEKRCPDNEREFILTESASIDAEQAKNAKYQAEALTSWTQFFHHKEFLYHRLLHNIEMDQDYIDTAEEKGRSPENIEKRRKQLEKAQERLINENQRMAFVKLLNDQIEEKQVKWLFLKCMLPNQHYDYYIQSYIIFENVAGESWHYVAPPYGQPFEPYTNDSKYLKKGLPDAITKQAAKKERKRRRKSS